MQQFRLILLCSVLFLTYCRHGSLLNLWKPFSSSSVNFSTIKRQIQRKIFRRIHAPIADADRAPGISYFFSRLPAAFSETSAYPSPAPPSASPPLLSDAKFVPLQIFIYCMHRLIQHPNHFRSDLHHKIHAPIIVFSSCCFHCCYFSAVSYHHFS